MKLDHLLVRFENNIFAEKVHGLLKTRGLQVLKNIFIYYKNYEKILNRKKQKQKVPRPCLNSKKKNLRIGAKW